MKVRPAGMLRPADNEAKGVDGVLTWDGGGTHRGPLADNILEGGQLVNCAAVSILTISGQFARSGTVVPGISLAKSPTLGMTPHPVDGYNA